MAGHKIGAHLYHPMKFALRGNDELANAVVFPGSHIPVRDYSSIYGARGDRDVEEQTNNEIEHDEQEYDEPELDR